MNKHARKLIKLNSKAQDCISREQAQKILKKYRKKMTKISEEEIRSRQRASSPQGRNRMSTGKQINMEVFSINHD